MINLELAAQNQLEVTRKIAYHQKILGQPLGGDFMFNASAEVQFPTPVLSEIEELKTFNLHFLLILVKHTRTWKILISMK